ncbi:hypothetical protein EVAR_15871_1 [Eumeta japonica]|uniref:Uncharacterized protein n=1 Tax=Eumeta variegata TaxID=151549 RepID=A0A4C1UE01_EUMVA|nr:hypothetical protein EVAR_15871_1 [Eumeta japonica]
MIRATVLRLGLDPYKGNRRMGVRPGRKRASAPPKLSLAERNTTTEADNSRPYSVRVSYLTGPAGLFSCYNRVNHSMAVPLPVPTDELLFESNYKTC